MTEKDKQDIIDAVIETITKVVNGKIDRLAVSVAGVHTRLDEQDIILEPAIETIATLRSGRKFLLWVLPIVAALGSLITVARAHI